MEYTDFVERRKKDIKDCINEMEDMLEKCGEISFICVNTFPRRRIDDEDHIINAIKLGTDDSFLLLLEDSECEWFVDDFRENSEDVIMIHHCMRKYIDRECLI